MRTADERRKNDRVTADFGVRVTSFPTETVYDARVGDLSKSGMRLIADLPAKSGQLIGVTYLEESTGARVEFVGEVRWQEGGALGIKVRAITDGDWTCLQHMVQNHRRSAERAHTARAPATETTRVERSSVRPRGQHSSR